MGTSSSKGALGGKKGAGVGVLGGDGVFPAAGLSPTTIKKRLTVQSLRNVSGTIATKSNVLWDETNEDLEGQRGRNARWVYWVRTTGRLANLGNVSHRSEI